MSRSASSFAARLRGGEPLLGALLRMPNEALIELAGLSGLDYVVIDTEHGPGDQIPLGHHLTAAAAAGLATLVRIGSPAEALRALDLGADGVLAPHVSSVEQATELASTLHYAPRGTRGFAGYTRAAHYGRTPAAEHHAAGADTVLVAMIEDPAGLAAAAGIAAVPGIDGLMLGPADYACEIGAAGRMDDARVPAARAVVRDQARAAGRAAMCIVGTPEAARQAFADGHSVVVYNVQQSLVGLFADLATAAPSAIPPSDAREPLVLVPGMLGDHTIWDGVVEGLTDIAAPQFARIDLDDSVAEMAATLLATAPPRFALAGHSLGAIVALEVARQAPERVTRLALVNASGRGPVAEQHTAWSALTDRLEREPFETVAGDVARSTVPEPRRSDPAFVGRVHDMARRVGADGLRRQLRAQQGRTSYLDDVARVAVPVLVISGGLDQVCPPERQRELVARCPAGDLLELADAGHLAPLEQPEAVRAALRSWLRPPGPDPLPTDTQPHTEEGSR